MLVARPRSPWAAIGPAVALVLVALIAVATYAATTAARAAFDDAAHSEQVAATLADLRTELDEAERGQRTYLLTGDPQYLDALAQAQRTVPQDVDELRLLMAPDARQQARLQQLEPVMLAGLANLARTADLRRTGGVAAAAGAVATKQGEALMTQVRSGLSSMEVDEKSRQAAQLALAQQRARQAVLTVAIGGSATVLFMILANLLIRREFRRRQRAEAALAEQYRREGQVKSDFVAVVSHELRAPLTSIKGYIDLLTAGEVGHLSSEQLECLEVVSKSADRLITLTTDLLDVTRLEAGRVELRRQAMPLPLLQEVTTAFQPQLTARQLTLTVDIAADLPPVLGDPDRLFQVFTNLLSNAVKYTPPGGAVDIGAALQRGQVQVDVRDSGIGMTREELDQLFSKFFRSAHPLVREVEGTGLGLTIVRSLVDLHNGTLQVTSVPRQGSTFSVRLPPAP